MTDPTQARTDEPAPADVKDYDAIMQRIAETIESRPALGVLLGGMLEHLEHVEVDEFDGAVLLAMFDFARKHPELALILAILGGHE